MNRGSQLFKHWYNRGCREKGDKDGVRFFYFYLCLNIVMADQSGEDVDAKMIAWIKTNPNSIKTAFDRLLQSNNPMFLKALQELQRLTTEQPLKSDRSNK